MSGTLSLATSIAAMNHEELLHLASHRRILSPANVEEPLELAIELLRPDSVSKALQGTHRRGLLALLRLSEGKGDEDPGTLSELRHLGLVGHDHETGTVTALGEVTKQLAGLDLATTPRPTVEQDAPSDTSTWYGSAITSVRRAAGVLRLLATRPVRLSKKGIPAVATVRDLAEAVHCEPEPIDRLLDVLREAGHVAPFIDQGTVEYLAVTRGARDWLALDYPHRWIALASAAAALIDDRLLQGLASEGLQEGRPEVAATQSLSFALSSLRTDYPLLPSTDIETASRAVATAEDLGLTVGGTLAPPARALLHGNVDAALKATERDIPAPVSGVYVQPDLSLIAPGPLSSEDEAAVSAISETENLGAAASYRLSAATLARAARQGIGPTDVRELLQRISLTRIPQPLEFLLTDLERTLAEGPALGGENRHVHETRVPPARNARTAHLPGTASTLSTTGTPGTAGTSASTDANEAIEEMVGRILDSRTSGEGDLTRKLKLAIRDKHTVQVTAVAGSDERVFVLLPVSLQAGRLRATDQQAGVERTLPVSAITAVTIGSQPHSVDS